MTQVSWQGLSQAFNGGSAIALAFRQEAALDVPRLTVCWSNLGRLVFARRA